MILKDYNPIYIENFNLSSIHNNNITLPNLLENILKRTKIYENIICDGTFLFFDDLPPEKLVHQQQKIKLLNYFTDTTELMNATLEELIKKLNECLIWIPFSTKNFHKIIKMKSETEGIRSGNLFAEKFLKYIDHVSILCCFNDLQQFNKFGYETLVNNIIKSFSQDVTTEDFTINHPVFTDLSTFIFGISNEKIDYMSKQTLNTDFWRYDITGLNLDNTTSIQIKYRTLAHDATTLDPNILDLTKNMDISWCGFTGPYKGLEKHKLAFNGGSFEQPQTIIIPTFLFHILGNDILKVFSTFTQRQSEWLRGYPIPYGEQIYSILKFYYNFSDEICTLQLRSIVAAMHHVDLEHVDLGIFSDIAKNISETQINTPNLKWRYVTFNCLEDVRNSLTINKTYNISFQDRTYTYTINHTFSIPEVISMIHQMNNITFVMCFESGLTSGFNMMYDFPYYSKNRDYQNCSQMTIVFTSNQIYI